MGGYGSRAAKVCYIITGWIGVARAIEQGVLGYFVIYRYDPGISYLLKTW